LRGAADLMFEEAAVNQMADVEWAMDWNAADDDYSSNGTQRPEDQVQERAATHVRGPAFASAVSDWRDVKAQAYASKHGTVRHYRMIAAETLQTLRRLRRAGVITSYKDVDLDINKTIKDSAGNTRTFNINGVLRKARPDWVIKDKTGKILALGEVAYSQGYVAARNKMNALGNAIGLHMNWRRIKKVKYP
jgi:hypothetical protein